MESAGVFLKLTDSKAIETFQSFLQGTEYLNITPAKLQYGEPVHLKGHQPNFPPSSGVYVFWIPERETYTSSSPSNKETTAPYPYDSALLLHEGKQQFGYYDLTFLLPAMAKAADGSMKRLGSKGRLYVAVWQGQRGKYNYDRLELLPASKPFLSVNGVPTESEDLRPLLRDGRAYIPLRSVAKLAGQSIAWDASTWSVLIRSNPPKQSKATYSYPQLWIDNKLASPELQPILLGGLTYVPIRALTAALGISVAWDRERRSVLIDL
ncbi:hypothetical protein PCCS19_55850 [Paenibacillus sp. CCS19]|uniref:stalk domain-containing protein n=1 Tax=Paenibacillus sp. CCS19 TaxID=3158387 RepID=UPI00256871CD|nr:stalk domain-containing protein [Paenibacillus cellulosilyticus]GMK42525.1 hypothetical protein PCCS19_55850 [Paenibacillus cellulosilyticus]